MDAEENKLVDLNKAIIDEIVLNEMPEMQVAVDVLRLDRIHPIISGNKWFKLKYYLQDAILNQYTKLLSFGGAYSNHILALAAAAHQAALSSVGLIRGEEGKKLSPTLQAAKTFGMELHFISRESYRLKEKESFLSELSNQFGKFYLVPEGGAGETGRKGSEEILQLADLSIYTHIICAIGTGTMFTGIANASLLNQEIIGIPVLKGVEESLKALSGQLHVPDKVNYCRFFTAHHFGGYAKHNKELIAFMNRFYEKTGIPTDFVYTAKLFYALHQLAAQHYFPVHSRVLAIHSGGLQGNDSLTAGSLLF